MTVAAPSDFRRTVCDPKALPDLKFTLKGNSLCLVP